MNATSTNKLSLSVFLKLAFFLFFIFTDAISWAQTLYTKDNNNSGWNNKNSWEMLDANSQRVPANMIPDGTNPVILTRTIGIPQGVSVNCKNLTISNTAVNVELNIGNLSILNVEQNVIVHNPASSGIINKIDITPGSTLKIGGALMIGLNPANSANAGTATVEVRSNTTVGTATLQVTGNILNNSGVNTSAPSSLTLAGASILEVGGGLNIGSKLGITIPASSVIRFNGVNAQTLPAMPAGVVFGNLHIASKSTVSLAEPLSPMGNLVIEKGNLDDKGYAITGRNAKDLIVLPGAQLIISYSDPISSEAFPASFGINDLQPGSTVVYNGTATQKLAALTYSNLQLLGGSGQQKIPLGPITAGNTLVSADLMLDKGKFTIGDNTLTLTTSGSIQHYDNLKYIVLGTNGKMVVETIGQTLNARSTEVTFPIGTSAGFSPAYLTNNGATYDFSVGVVNGVVDYATGNPILQDGVNKTWNIECIGQASGLNPDVDLRLQWNSATDELSKFDRTKCFVTHYTNGAWSNSDIFQNAANNGMSASMKNVTSFSPFSVADAASPLPVELTFFKAARKETAVLLNWATASEKNCLGYDVLASSDGKNFEFVGNVASKNGNAAYVQQYEFLDKTSRTGFVYYRLKQTDLDGTVTYYATQVVDMGRFTETLAAFPNPFQNRFELKLQSAAAQEVLLHINDLTGKTVYQMAQKVVAGETVLPVELSESLPAGIYILTAKTSSQLLTSRLIKQ